MTQDPVFNPFDPAQVDDQWDQLAALRDTDPAAQVMPGAYFVTRFADVSEIARDHRRFGLAASCVADFAHETIERALKPDGSLSGGFSEPQRTFLAQCSDIRFAFEGLTALGPIAATQWKDFTFGDVEHVTAERWMIPGMDVLELSIRSKTGAEAAAAEQDKLEHAVQHRNLEFDQSKDPKTDRVMKRLAGLD